MSRSRVALIGFMGAGKTTVGRLLAGLLGWDFADLDALVEQEAGCPVAEIFRREGEAGFRRREAARLEALRSVERVVIAVGGGAPLRKENEAFFRGSDFCVYLRTPLETALGRIGTDPGRPMLAGGREAAEALYEKRLPAYEAMGRAVDTDGKAPEQVAGEIAALLYAAGDGGTRR